MQFNELTLRTRTGIIIGSIAIVFIVLFGVIALGGSKESDALDDPAVDTAGDPETTASLPLEAVQIIKREAASNPVILVHSFARSFAERFGSFSNAADFGNLTDLEVFMTPRMQAWAEKTIAEERKKRAGSVQEYYGIVTRALAVTDDTVDMRVGKGSVTVSTQRRETSGTTVRMTQEDLYMELERIGSDWKVDGAEWVDHNDGE